MIGNLLLLVFLGYKLAVYNHWTGLVVWTGGLDWWTDIKKHFMTTNKTHWPVGLYDALC